MNNCFMTLMTNKRFLPCVIRCHQSLIHVNSKYPYIVLIPETDKFLELELIKYNIKFKKIKIDQLMPGKKIEYNDTINKFQIFNYVEYDKIFFLDADTIIYQNIDNEFEKLKLDKIYLFSEQYNKKHFITGCAFICRPNKNFYLTVLQDQLKYQWMDDEHILDYYFSQEEKQRSLPKGILHLGGKIKPWEITTEDFPFFQKFFISMPIEEFYYYLDNIHIVFSFLQQRSFLYNVKYNFAYAIFITEEKQIPKIIELKTKMLEYGYFYPLICLVPNNINIIKQLNYNNIFYEIIKDSFPNTIINKIKIIYKYLGKRYFKILLIKDEDFLLNENFEYIFSNTLLSSIKTKFIKKYINLLFLINFNYYLIPN